MNNTTPIQPQQDTATPQLTWSKQNLAQWNIFWLDEGRVLLMPPIGAGKQMISIDPDDDHEDGPNPNPKAYLDVLHSLCTMISDGMTTDINIHNAVGDNEPIAYEAAAQWMQAWRPEAQHRA